MDLELFHKQGIETLLKAAMHSALHSPRQAAFLAKFALSAKRASDKRDKSYADGLHVPPFLIASITTSCNLHCVGCYARANHSCVDHCTEGLLTASDWDAVFSQAEQLGISFILLAGGEPLLRRDVLEKAAEHRDILFPVFTNGTLFSSENELLFDQNRNLIPILSIEGDREQTDSRRGEGIYDRVFTTMDQFQQKSILFGASVTVTTDNLREVASDSFIGKLSEYGCRLVIFVEYVPADGKSAELAPGETERALLAKRLDELRENGSDMLLISFPGDELASGGCLAAGRGFFHINPRGQAEPCPFSPYSDTNVLTSGLEGALRSPLFRALDEAGMLSVVHNGGCALFGKEDLVQSLCEK